MGPGRLEAFSDYLQKVLPVIDRQLGLAGLRLARFLNQSLAPGAVPVPAPLSPFCTGALSE